jgi:retinoblastoma-like protein 1
LVQLGETVPATAPISSRPKDEDKNDKDGKDGSGPGSPRPSFPALPDMSPKKVSASHNVYVSPLRSTKMDTLMSPHTRSLYACVGESTHAYQSPSKDLTAINNRLNNRRLGTRLDFNGASLVSDSMVAGSLYPCTRNGNHHSVRLTTDSVLSSQSQPSWTAATPLPPSPLKRPCAER